MIIQKEAASVCVGFFPHPWKDVGVVVAVEVVHLFL